MGAACSCASNIPEESEMSERQPNVFVPDATDKLDKPSLIAELLQMDFSMDRILRAFKVYENIYGTNYNLHSITEIILRLQKKDNIKKKEQSNSEEKLESKHCINDDIIIPTMRQVPSFEYSWSSNYTQFARSEACESKSDHSTTNTDDNENSQEMSKNSLNVINTKKKRRFRKPKGKKRKRKHRKTKANDKNNVNNKTMQYSKSENETDERKALVQQKHNHSSNHLLAVNDNAYCDHMSWKEACNIKLYDMIDHRDNVGKFCVATVIDVKAHKLKIHYDGFSEIFDVWSDRKQRLFRFAKHRSISRRKQVTDDDDNENFDTIKLSMKSLKVGDFVDFNPMHKTDHNGGNWVKGIVNKFDRKSSQLQIAYKEEGDDEHCSNTDDYWLYWTHIENTMEIAKFRTKNKCVTVDVNLSLRLDESKIHFKDLSEIPENLQKNRDSVYCEKVPIQSNVNAVQQDTMSDNNTMVLNIHEEEETERDVVSTRDCGLFQIWDTNQVLDWLNGIENGKFANDIYDHFKSQCDIIGLKGYDLPTMNDIALRFAGIYNANDRKLILENILNLINSQNNKIVQERWRLQQLIGNNRRSKTEGHIDDRNSGNHNIKRSPDTRSGSASVYLNEVVSLWK